MAKAQIKVFSAKEEKWKVAPEFPGYTAMGRGVHLVIAEHDVIVMPFSKIFNNIEKGLKGNNPRLINQPIVHTQYKHRTYCLYRPKAGIAGVLQRKIEAPVVRGRWQIIQDNSTILAKKDVLLSSEYSDPEHEEENGYGYTIDEWEGKTLRWARVETGYGINLRLWRKSRDGRLPGNSHYSNPLPLP